MTIDLQSIKIEDVRRNPEKMADVRKAQEEIWNLMPESSRAAYFKFKNRDSCSAKAHARPLPGESAGAFLDGDLVVCGKIVRRFVPAHFMVLQKIESPMLSIIEEAIRTKSTNANLKAQEEWDLCYIFTNDPKVVFLECKAGGAKAIHDKSENEIGLVWKQEEIEMVIYAIFEQFTRHIETKVKIAAQESEKGEIRFFRVPATEVSTATESAG